MNPHPKGCGQVFAAAVLYRVKWRSLPIVIFFDPMTKQFVISEPQNLLKHGPTRLKRPR